MIFIGKNKEPIISVLFIALTHFYKVTNLWISGPFFDEIKLSEIALELDRKEKNLMQAHGMTHNY